MADDQAVYFVDQKVHERWEAMTDGGKADSRVADMTKMFDDLAYKLRAHFNTHTDDLRDLERTKERAIARLKFDIVFSPMCSAQHEAQRNAAG